jgi:hypothetical protein
MPSLRVRAWTVFALAAALVAGCATPSRTTLDTSWVSPQVTRNAYKKVLIVSVAADEFAQEAFQKQMAAALQARGVNAVASGAYFTRYTANERARFERIIKGSDADAVLLARVIRVDSKQKASGGYIIGTDGQPYADSNDIWGAYARVFDPTHYVAPNDYVQNTLTAEGSLYEKGGQKLVWSARTVTTNSQAADSRQVIERFVEILVGSMAKDGVL